MTPNNLKKETSWGGVVYGFNDTYVRIWVPGFDTGKIFSVADGWGIGSQETWSEGLVKVRVWGHMPGDSVYKSNATIGQSPGMHSSQLGSVGGRLNIDTGLVSVMVKALSGDNKGFFFPALGAVQNTDPHDKFGGVVYSYSSNGIRVWHPIIPGGGNTSLYSKGTLIYVSPYWGGGAHSQDSKFGLIEVQFWNSYTGKCPPPTTPAKASTSPFTGTITKSSGSHTSGPTGGSTTSSRPVTSVPLLTSTSSILTTVTVASTGGTRQASTVTTFAGASTGGPSAGSNGKTTRSTGTRTTSGSRVTGRTGGPASATTKNSLTAGNQEEQGDEGLSPVATGLVATASILSAAGCLGGLIFGLLKKKAKKKRKVDPELEENDAFGSQKVVDDNGKPPSNDGTPPNNDGHHQPDEVSPPIENETSPIDNGSPPIDNGSPPIDNGSPPIDNGSPPIDNGSPPIDNGSPPIDNGSPPADNGTPPAATDRPQTARPE
ncbi:mucin-19-like [Pecten maximus]|uniref:mucin-19-like n=1 Tax=Pecten maximus TaxID=6579 RepID=UPI0014590F4F|nr:mucin-19-like [Pecten maximus]